MDIMDDRASTKDKIITVALELFSKSGVDGVSIADITRKVGIAKSSLYSHFKTKQAILDHIIELYRNEIKNLSLDPTRFDTLVRDMTPEDFWNMILDRYLQTWGSKYLSQISRLIVLEQYKTETALVLILEETRRILTLSEHIFSMMRACGKVARYPADELAREFAYAIRGMLLEHDLVSAHGGDTTEIKATMRAFIECFCKKIKP